MNVKEAYFDWMYELVCHDRFAPGNTFIKLLRHLHEIEFVYSIPLDKNRYVDGLDLRYRFAYDHPDIEDAERYLTGPCSILEMTVALALRCEETIMTDPLKGDRTGQWFWRMMISLGLGAMYDDRYNENHVDLVIKRFLNHAYKPNGEGGLYTVRDCKRDLRECEIWIQMHCYLNTIA